jgi:coatomer subunit beta'
MWKEDLSSISETAAKALASPSENPDLFADHDIALQVEQMFMAQRAASSGAGIPASDYMTAKDDLELNLIDLLKQRADGAPPAAPPEADPAPPEADPASPEADAVMVDAGEAAAASEAEALAAEQARIAAEQEAAAAAAAAAEQARIAAEQEAAAAAEAQRLEEERLAQEAAAAAEAAKEDDMDDFGDDW